MSPGSPDIPNIAGPFLLGYLLNYGLYGVLTLQTYIYYTAFPKDRTAVQAIVYGLYIVETTQTVMITWDAFQNFTFGFGGAGASLAQINLIWFDCCIIDGAVAFVVQTYYAYRIHMLSKSRLLMAAIIFMSLVQLGGAITTAGIAKKVGQFSDREKDFIAAGFWLGGSAACDIVIAVSMTYILSKHGAGFPNTKDLLKRIIRLTIETGSLTATLATVDLILFLAFPSLSYHITPALILAKIYSNSLMVILNSRVKILGGRGQSALSRELIFTSERDSVLESRDQREMMFVLQTRTRDCRGRQDSPELEFRVEQEIEAAQPSNVAELHTHPQIQLDAKPEPQKELWLERTPKVDNSSAAQLQPSRLLI